MKLIYCIQIFLIVTIGFLRSDCSSSQNFKKRALNSSISSDSSLSANLTEEKYISDKRQKMNDSKTITELEFLIENGLVLCFINALKKEGCHLLHPDKSSLLELIVRKGNSEIIDKIFSSICKGNVEILMRSIELCVDLNYPILYNILSGAYDQFSYPPSIIILYFLNLKDFKAINIMFNIGYRFDRISNITHYLARNCQHEIINKFGRNLNFDKKDSAGKIALFYANDKKTIKAIRRVSRNGRDQMNFQGLTIWQEVLLDKNYKKLNFLISFKRRIKKMKKFHLNYFNIPWVSSASILRVNRNSLLESSFKRIEAIKSRWYRPKHQFFIKFIDEIGLDNGGLKIDWISNLFQKFFIQNPTGTSNRFTAPLFIKIDEESGVYAPNSEYSSDLFKFAGSIVGISLGLGVPIKVKLMPLFYKIIYRQEIDIKEDLIAQSPSIYKNLQLLLDPEFDFSEASLTFPSNPTISVNKRNVKAYIMEFSNYVLFKKYEKEILSFANGFLSVQPVKISNYVSKDELIKILIGKANEYTADEFIESISCASKKVKRDLHKLISEMNPVQKRILLKFITGSDCLPIEGFVGLEKQINISIFEFLAGKLPEASTCSNTLKLPPYTDYEELKRVLIMAIEMTFTLDQEHGLTENDEIVLGFDDFSDSDLNIKGLIEQESESDVSNDEFDGADGIKLARDTKAIPINSSNRINSNSYTHQDN